MFREILNKNQQELLPLIKVFSKNHYLVGGTAIALQIGHRESIDFDLFTANKKIKRRRIRRIISESGFSSYPVLYEDDDQMHIVLNDVKLTFFNYMYSIPAKVDFEGVIKMPSLLDLAAMKALALGGRAKWKDYTDLYFLFKNHVTFRQVANRAAELFGGAFNAKLFREQLTYYKDVNYSEEVVFMPDKNVEKETIEELLTDIATRPINLA
ncbi:MAG: nucleotidyl transferase AbiEii/AbiGii toxin family protein [Bacteroidota bacterium]